MPLRYCAHASRRWRPRRAELLHERRREAVWARVGEHGEVVDRHSRHRLERRCRERRVGTHPRAVGLWNLRPELERDVRRRRGRRHGRRSRGRSRGRSRRGRWSRSRSRRWTWGGRWSGGRRGAGVGAGAGAEEGRSGRSGRSGCGHLARRGRLELLQTPRLRRDECAPRLLARMCAEERGPRPRHPLPVGDDRRLPLRLLGRGARGGRGAERRSRHPREHDPECRRQHHAPPHHVAIFGQVGASRLPNLCQPSARMLTRAATRSTVGSRCIRHEREGLCASWSRCC